MAAIHADSAVTHAVLPQSFVISDFRMRMNSIGTLFPHAFCVVGARELLKGESGTIWLHSMTILDLNPLRIE
jgi:hypothetical protein